MNVLELPQDVLLPILELLSQHDTAQLARASWAAHALAMPRVLSNVELGTEPLAPPRKELPGRLPQVVSFTSLVLRNPDVYAHHIKSLALHMDAIDPRSEGDVAYIPSLVEVIRHTSNLRKLVITRTESLLELSSTLFDVIASHDGLRALKLGYFGKKALSLLARMKSGLHEIALEYFNDHSFDFACLRSYMATLKVFRIKGVVIICAPCDSDVWGHVHTLDLHTSYDYTPEVVTSLPRAFPQVRVLSIQQHSSYPLLTPPIAWPSIEALRLSPRAVEPDHSCPSSQPRRSRCQ
ncbi:hypothetical protein L226DRAFT_245405 [Lentinus tigrinus ALCF2SS1-7]|uniref:F-box domain-containing protein n=1 Tax=Lentinus tigrinus ALCF2SS1-6 TaxID=1328759 RepID=A0A5C2SNA5_9APHY|nr:hypothetical protein L227DRAFT_208363 [Lentinus tigrinus ALCF2SS1-6]RPD79264.1 hypothetical protein L226DRAFT_245405 [Lentinus tigrinus ALCF2SS1-7]